MASAGLATPVDYDTPDSHGPAPPPNGEERKAKDRYLALDYLAVSEVAKELVAALERVICPQRGRADQHEKNRQALAAMLPDLLMRPCFRSLQRNSFSGACPVKHHPFVRVLDGLKSEGFISHIPGGLKWVSPPFPEPRPDGTREPPVKAKGTASTFAALEPLVAFCGRFGVTTDNLDRHFSKHAMPLLYKVSGETGQPIPYTPAWRAEAERIEGFNTFLQGRVTGAGHIRLVRHFDSADGPEEAPPPSHGRMYADYSRMPKDARGHILVDGEPVVEWDISASYLTIYLGMCGIQIDTEADPYAFPGLERVDVKDFINWSLVQGKLRTRWGKGGNGRTPMRRIKPVVLERYPALASLDGSRGALWRHLMFRESEAVLAAMECLRSMDVPSLPMHDALIVPASKASKAKEVLESACRYHWGVWPRTKESKEGVR